MSDTENSAAELEQAMAEINRERAHLVTTQPDGWATRYGELGDRLTLLARRWQEAAERESRYEL